MKGLPKADYDLDLEADNILPATELIDMCMDAISITLSWKDEPLSNKSKAKLKEISKVLAEQRRQHVQLQMHLEQEFHDRMQDEELSGTEYPA